MPDPASLEVVFVAASRGSTWVHLTAEQHSDLGRTTLCGLQASDQTPKQWFALAGCADCARIALSHGVDHVADLDGSEVPLVDTVR